MDSDFTDLLSPVIGQTLADLGAIYEVGQPAHSTKVEGSEFRGINIIRRDE
jgi:hypothetical protein